jgi:hypothetical protein
VLAAAAAAAAAATAATTTTTITCRFSVAFRRAAEPGGTHELLILVSAGFTFPIEKRRQLQAIIGDRAERLAYLTCAKDGKSFNDYVMLNRNLRQGETPTGYFTPRFNYAGYWPHAGYGALAPDHQFTLTAEEYTEMCAVQVRDNRLRKSLSRLFSRQTPDVIGKANDGVKRELCRFLSALPRFQGRE